MSNYTFDYSDYEDKMNSNDNEPTPPRGEFFSNETSIPPDWWVLGPKESGLISYSTAGASLPDHWFLTSSSSEATDSPPRESSNESEASVSSVTESSSDSDLGSWS